MRKGNFFRDNLLQYASPETHIFILVTQREVNEWDFKGKVHELLKKFFCVIMKCVRLKGKKLSWVHEVG